MDLLFIRHGETAWNASKRIQGQSDIPLSPAGRAEVAARRLPREFAHWRWFASPLLRALETARLLGAGDPHTVADLREMDWGEWQGQTLADLRARHGEAMRENEQRGLDFRPHGGESPREVRARLARWLGELDSSEGHCIVVTHKGVMRAALSLATHWDYLGKPPVKLNWGSAHRFRLHSGDELSLFEPNIDIGGRDARS